MRRARRPALRGAAARPVTRPGAAELRALGRALPALWASGRLTPAQQQELLRRRIRRVIVTRPVPDTIEAKVVWVRGAVTPLTGHPPILRGAEVRDDPACVARVLALGAAGHTDRVIAQRLAAAGCHAARRAGVPASVVNTIRRTPDRVALTAQFRTATHHDGQWTIWGLARELGVQRNWRYARIRRGARPATRHPATGHDRIPDDPELGAQLRAQRERCCYREEGRLMTASRPTSYTCSSPPRSMSCA